MIYEIIYMIYYIVLVSSVVTINDLYANISPDLTATIKLLLRTDSHMQPIGS